MSSAAKLNLIEENIAANKNSDKKSTAVGQVDFVGALTITNYVSGTYTVLIEHSADGVNWQTLITFANLSADGHETVEATLKVLPNVRANITVAGGDADVKVDLLYDQRK